MCNIYRPGSRITRLKIILGAKKTTCSHRVRYINVVQAQLHSSHPASHRINREIQRSSTKGHIHLRPVSPNQEPHISAQVVNSRAIPIVSSRRHHLKIKQLNASGSPFSVSSTQHRIWNGLLKIR